MILEHVVIGEIKPDFFSWLIRNFLSWKYGRKVNFSHAGILINGTRLIHSTGKGIHESKLEDELATGCEIRGRVKFYIPPELEGRVEGYIQRAIGTHYPHPLQMIPFAIPCLRTIPWMDNGRAVSCCSEWSTDVLVDCVGVKDDRFNDTDWVDPFLADLVSRAHGLVVI